MAQRTIVRLIDDIDGGEADETVEFSFRGQAFEIDLAAEHIKEMAEFLGPFMEAGRKTSAPTIRGRATRSVASAAARREDYNDVRRWAAENGYTVSNRGRIAREVLEAYRNR